VQDVTRVDGTGRVVVGVDGSDSSLAAALWAVAEARRCASSLAVVCVWEGVTRTPSYAPFEMVSVIEPKQAAQAALDEVVRRVRSSPEAAGVSIEPLLLEGVAGPALVDESEGADLLVVGSHGRGAVSRVVLGSVSSYCVHHAHCSTVVVPYLAVRVPVNEPVTVPAVTA